MEMIKKYRKGAASFYIVIITSLLFGVIVVGFMSLVTREIKKSQENSLYQASYDSALAGVEDAKLALSKYYDCVNNQGITTAERDNGDGVTTCEEILGFVNDDAANAEYCDVVRDILERNGTSGRGYDAMRDDVNNEVKIIEDTANGETTAQAYTCVKLDLTPSDYRATLSSSDTTIRVVPLQTVNNQAINKVRISWYATGDGEGYNYNNASGGEVVFNRLNDSSDDGQPATPPTLAVQLYQTGEGSFNLSQFNEASEVQTNRGTVWLVPSSDRGVTELDKDILVQSNVHDSSIAHEGQLIECSPEGKEFACEATIELPEPIGGARSMDAYSFMLAISLPYNEPVTDFKVEMLNGDTIVRFKNVQVAVDSTGRANDIFSRLESRVEFNDVYFPYPEYALELGSGNGGTALSKNFWVTENCWSSTEGRVTTCADSGSDD